MQSVAGLFEIKDAKTFFVVIQSVLESFRATTAKRPADLLLLILGLKHLSEWIAPSYKKGSTPKDESEAFVSSLFENENYQTLWAPANHVKHQRRTKLPQAQSTTTVSLIGSRDTPISTWLDFDEGPSSTYLYGDKDLEQVFVAVASLYDQWFRTEGERKHV